MQRRPHDDGVSPLIATILLIAIAVALGVIVLEISENLAEETVTDPPPSTAFTIRDHPDQINMNSDPGLDNEVVEEDCTDRLLLITVDEEILLRDFRIRLGQDDAFFDIWGQNETMRGNVNETFKLWVDNFPAGPGGNDYELVVDQAETDRIEAGTSFMINETYHRPNPAHNDQAVPRADAENRWCQHFQFGDEVQIQIIHASGTTLKDVTIQLV